MRRIGRTLVLSCLIAVWFSFSSPCDGAGIQTMKTIALSEGSVPPAFRESFGCIYELDDKPFSDLLIQDCVAKLRTNYFIRDVKVHTREMDEGRGVISVEFVLSSEPLKMEGLTIKTFDAQEPDIWKIISRSDDNLHVGGIYNWDAESTTYFAITFFYRAQGKLVGVIPEVKLDYKQGKAWVNFRIVEGPAMLKSPLTPPYGEWCEDRISYVDYSSWSSSDDAVPLELIESGLTLAPPFTCFSDELAKRDKNYLSHLSILSASSVEYSGPFGNRHIKYNLKAKPLKVGKINLRGYGGYTPTDLEDGDPSLLQNLKIKTGELFSRRVVQESSEYLRKAYARDGYWANVTVQEEVSGTDTLNVTFSVLVFPLQTVIVDGHVLQSTAKLTNCLASAGTGEGVLPLR
jgi:hypothetical protein